MRTVFAIYIFILAGNVLAVNYEYQFRNYDVNDGLPSTQVYQIIEDKQGYIWFGTDRGLVCYNGYEFKKYTIENGLSTNVIFKLDILPSGQISCYGKDRKIHILGENDQFFPFFLNDSLNTKISLASNLISFDFNKSGVNFFISDSLASYVHFNYGKTSSVNKKNGILIRDDSDGFGISLMRLEETLPFFYYNGKKKAFQNDNYNRKLGLSGQEFVAIDKMGLDYYFSAGSYLYTYNPKKDTLARLIDKYEHEILMVEIDKYKNVYIGFREIGVWKFPHNEPEKIKCILSDISCSSIFFGKNEGLWIGSIYKGLFYCPNQNIRTLDLEGDKMAVRVKATDNRLFLISKEDSVYEFKKNLMSPLGESNCQDISNKYLILRGWGGNKGKVIDLNNDKNCSNLYLAKDYFNLNDTFYNVGRASISKNILCSEKRSFYYLDVFVNTGMFLPNGEVIVGTDVGVKYLKEEYCEHYQTNEDIFYYKVVNLPTYKSDVLFFKNRIKSMINIGDTMLVFASAESGIYIERINQSPLYISKRDGIISDAVERIYQYDEYLIVNSFEGLSVISNDGDIVNFSRGNGLLSNVVYDVALVNDTLYAATDHGLSMISLKKMNQREIPIYLTAVSINGKNRGLSKRYEMNYTENALDVSFEGVEFIYEGNISYKYQLKGIDTEWISTTSRSVRYVNLPSGKFSFNVKTQNVDKTWTKPVHLFDIEKYKPFWENIFFILLMILLTVLGIWYLVHSYYRRQRNRERNKYKVLNLERKTLQAQMNPHFVFNSLTSLQSLIIDDRKLESQE